MIATTRLALLGLSLALGGCSVLEGDKVDYKSAASAPSLAVPPDLTQLSRDNRYAIPGGPVTASSYQIGQATTSVPVAAKSIGDVRIERSGNQRWLVVKRNPEELWDPIKDFWQEYGFLLSLDQKNLGIMETDWAENRAKIPQDLIRQSLGKLLDSLYSTAERDRFRTRLERNAAGETEIFISHRGMIEVYPSGNAIAGQNDAGTIWQPRPADPELEAEFLRRLMVKLGVSQEQAKAAVAATGERKCHGAGRAGQRAAGGGGGRRHRPRLAPGRPVARPYRLHRRGPRPQQGHLLCTLCRTQSGQVRTRLPRQAVRQHGQGQHADQIPDRRCAARASRPWCRCSMPPARRRPRPMPSASSR